jgi:hypothetical protein
MGGQYVTAKPTKLERPDVHFDAILALVGVLLGFLFIVVIYFLEYPQEFSSTWGMPLIMYLVICYALGLTIIGYIISHEINFYLANRLVEIAPDPFPTAQFTKLKLDIQRSLRRSIQMFLYFIFSFGLFLINLASFAAGKFFSSIFAHIENNILLLWGPIALVLIRLVVMFIVQLILILPFSRYQGNLWDAFKAIENLQSTDIEQ